ncbi:electron transfer flavoprotein subunit alpha/FixB family protein, partial [bacterium]|nr:electron transfer flavoprotein subunit alpha/FixB family protein [bacterium]
MANGILIIAEHRDGKLKKSTYELLNSGAKIASALTVPLEAAVLGENISELVGSIRQFGASKIYSVESSQLKDFTPEGYKTVLKKIIEENNNKVVLIGATPVGKDLAPRLSASLGVGYATDCIGLTLNDNGRLTFTRPIYAGKAITTMTCESDPQIATLRPNVFSAEKPDFSGPG